MRPIKLIPKPPKLIGAKLNIYRVKALRQAHANGATYPELAKQYGVTERTIDRVVSRKSWRFVE